MKKRFDKYINSNNKVLEIWTGLWNFASYCTYKWIKDYTWIEIDKWIAKKLWKIFDGYKIICIDALNFLEKTPEKYDIIYMNHVFEHFTIEDGIILAIHIKQHLSHDWIWINTMPNAGCISGCLGRYSDITHKTIYSSNSFNQVILEAWFDKDNIHHFNVFPNGFIKRMFVKLLWMLLWVEYNTFQLMTITKNKSE